VSGAESSAVGGSGNKVTGDYSSAVGGSDHTASALYSTAVGGIGHTISGEYAAALGGVENTVQGKRSVALGGNMNQALADYGIVHGLNAQAKRAFERTYASGSPEYQAGDGIVLSGSTPGDGQPHSIDLTLQDGSGNGWDVSASGPAGYTLNVRAFASNGSFDDSEHYSCASWDMTILVAYDGTNYYLQGWYVQGTGAGQGAPTIATGDGSSWTLTPTLYSPTEAPFYLFELEFANGAGSSAVCACTAALSWTQGPF